MPVEANITTLLEAGHIPYEVVEHEPVYTNPAMAQALGVGEAETVKFVNFNTVIQTIGRGEMIP